MNLPLWKCLSAEWRMSESTYDLAKALGLEVQNKIFCDSCVTSPQCKVAFE